MRTKETIEKIKQARHANAEKTSLTVRKKSGRGDSGCKGVYPHRNNKWQVKLKFQDGKVRSLGCFESVEDAAKNYDFHAILEYGKGNCFLNFPDFDYKDFKPLKNFDTTHDTAIVSVDYNIKT